MQRDWQEIFNDYKDFDHDGLGNLLQDDEGIFEALWNYVVNDSLEDVGLVAIDDKITALDMLLSIGICDDEVCLALVMDKEGFAEALCLVIKEMGLDGWRSHCQDVMKNTSDLVLWYNFKGTDAQHDTAVRNMVLQLADDCKDRESWGPLRLLRSVLARAIRGNVDPRLVKRGCETALEVIDILSSKQQCVSDERMAWQLDRERDRWYSFLVEVSAYTQRAAPGKTGRDPEPRADPSSVRVKKLNRLEQAQAAPPPARPPSPVPLRATAAEGRYDKGGVEVRDANAREVERRLVDAAVQGEQQLRDHLLALVAPDLHAGSSETLQEFHRMKCRVSDDKDVSALFRFGASLVHWVASPDEGLGRHLSDLGTNLRAFADGLDEGLGTGEKYDAIMRTFATIGSEPGFRLPRGTAIVLCEIEGCLEHAASSAGPVSSAASTAGRILASILTGGYPCQAAIFADATSDSSELWRQVDGGGPSLQIFLEKIFHLLTRMAGEAREAMALVLLTLLDHLEKQSGKSETNTMLVCAVGKSQEFLRQGSFGMPGPWLFRLWLRLLRALNGVHNMEFRVIQEHKVACDLCVFRHDCAFLLLVTVVDFGGALSQAASAVLFGVRPGWQHSLEDLSPFRFMQEIAGITNTLVLGQGSSDPLVEDAAVLSKFLLKHCLETCPSKRQRLAVMGLLFLISSEATLQDPNVKDMEQTAPLLKGLVSIASAYMGNCNREDLLVGDQEVWSPEMLDWLYQSPQLRGLVVAGLACRCLVQPSRSGVSLVLQLAFKVLSNCFQPESVRLLDIFTREDLLVVLESVLGILTKGRPPPTLADPRALQLLRGMPQLVKLISKYRLEAARAGLSGVMAVADMILQHLGVARCV